MTGPYEVEVVDTPYARPGGLELLARLYRPKGDAGAARAAVVYVHGGAWARLDRTADAILCPALAASGRTVVALDFRQAPDHRFPTACADVAAGVRYTRTHARRLGVDPARIGLLGSSSGGLLALLHAVRPGAPEGAGTPVVTPDGTLDATPHDAAVAFVVAASVLGVVSGGVLADRLARRYRGGRMMTQALGLFAGVPFIFLTGWTLSVPMLVLAMAGFGYFKGLYDANIWASLYDVVKPERRATAVGLMNSLAWFGGGMAPVAIAAASQRYGMSTCISANSVVYLGIGLLLVFGIHRFMRAPKTARPEARP